MTNQEDFDDYGGGDYEDTQVIFQSAPQLKNNDWKQKTIRSLNSEDCLVHGSKWQDRIKELLELLKQSSSEIELKESSICTCKGKSTSEYNCS